MQYQGGKSKIAKKIADAILADTKNRGVLYDPFVGGGSVAFALAPHFEKTHASDLCEDLILMWQGLQDGSFDPPEHLSEETYNALKSAPPSALRAFAGFGCSFGGKWFGGYARGGLNSRNELRNHCSESRRLLMKYQNLMKNVILSCRDYFSLEPRPGDVVYLDPPYDNTLSYAASGRFNSKEFWAVAEGWSKAGVDVFVSEFTAPDGWTSILTFDRSRGLRSNTEKTATEKLFKWCSND